MNLVPALSRPMDWSYASNRFIVIVTPLVGLLVGLGALPSSSTLGAAAALGFSAAGATFLAWAIARELHPDRVWVAVGAALVAPVGLVWGSGDLLGSAAVLLVIRAVAGTTGRSLRVADLILLTAIGLPVMMRAPGPAVLGVGALGLALTAVWHDHHRSTHVAAAVLYAVGSIASLLVSDPLALVATADPVPLWIGLGAGAAALFGPAAVTTMTDRPGATVEPYRVRLARAVAFVTAAAVSLSVDPAAMGPVWAALVAVAVWPR